MPLIPKCSYLQCPFSLSCFAVPVDSGHCALSSLLSVEDLPPVMVPSVSSNVSCKKLVLLTWGPCHRQGPCPEAAVSLIPFHLGSVWAFPMHGREAAQGPPLWNLLRHLSDSETHFYLFTVNSYRCSQQLRHFCQWCLLLASPLGFQDRLPRNCLSLPPVLPCLPVTSLLSGFTSVYHWELCRPKTWTPASAQASTPCLR